MRLYPRQREMERVLKGKTNKKKCCDIRTQAEGTRFREGPEFKVQNCVLSKAFLTDRKRKEVDVSDGGGQMCTES